MKLSQFKYRLPEERIAQYPCEFGPDEERPYFHRDDCRLMVVHAKSGVIEHRESFRDIINFFDEKDVAQINEAFAQIKAKEKIIITTEKDATRLKNTEGLSEAVKEAIFVLPIEVEIMQDQKDSFNEKILSYVLKNSRNSVLAKSKDADKSRYSHHPGNRIRKIGR